MTITAKIIADSINPFGIRITTFELVYPRMVHCFDDQTEILSQINDEVPIFRSFKDVSNLQCKVAQYHSENETIEFVKPNAYIENYYSGDMISLENHSRLNFMVTEEHRMFVGSRKKDVDKKEIILAKDLLDDHTQKRFYKSGQLRNKSNYDPELMKLVAYFISDGTLPKNSKQAVFNFKKERKINEVCRLLNCLNIDYKVFPCKNSTKIVFNRLDWMVDCYDENFKKILPSKFYDMDNVSFNSFKQGLLESDGNVKNQDFNTSSEKLIDQLQSLFTVHGESFNKKSYLNKNGSIIFKVKFLTEDTPVLRSDKHKVEKVRYTGKVYCVNVPTGLIVVRRKGIVHISGNCELMTHRLFSRNAASSRAIPISAVIEQVRSNPATPSHWGKNQPGMQARVELEGVELDACKAIWNDAMLSAVMHAERMTGINAHKQVANRILEPFVHMKTVLTATEFNNWWWLRDHEDADPTIHELAEEMRVAYNSSTPDQLKDGEWHMPYVSWGRDDDDVQMFQDENFNDISVEQSLKISASCCAQVSYRKNDPSLAKAEDIYDKLVLMEPVHSSPFEHQAKCCTTILEDINRNNHQWREGITHIDRYGNWWSGNLKQWIQHRQLIPNNVKRG